MSDTHDIPGWSDAGSTRGDGRSDGPTVTISCVVYQGAMGRALDIQVNLDGECADWVMRGYHPCTASETDLALRLARLERDYDVLHSITADLARVTEWAGLPRLFERARAAGLLPKEESRG